MGLRLGLPRVLVTGLGLPQDSDSGLRLPRESVSENIAGPESRPGRKTAPALAGFAGAGSASTSSRTAEMELELAQRRATLPFRKYQVPHRRPSGQNQVIRNK